MELHIQKEQNQKKGVLGGLGPVEFTLSVRLILNGEESDLVKKYGACLPSLLTSCIDLKSATKDFEINDFLAGQKFKRSYIGSIANLEGEIRKIPEVICNHLLIAKEWTGEEVIKLDVN